LHDGIEIERKDVPATVVLTDNFIGTAVTAAKMGGLPGYPFVVIPHPISRKTREQLREAAEAAAGEVFERLVSLPEAGRAAG
jgi:hypothetical protein